jgi:hypothetical protein
MERLLDFGIAPDTIVSALTLLGDVLVKLFRGHDLLIKNWLHVVDDFGVQAERTPRDEGGRKDYGREDGEVSSTDILESFSCGRCQSGRVWAMS